MLHTVKKLHYIACIITLMMSPAVVSNAEEPVQHLSHPLTPIQCGNQDIADSVHIEAFIPAPTSSATPFIHCNGLSAIFPYPSAVEIVNPVNWNTRGDLQEGKLYLCSGTLTCCQINYEP